MVDLAGTGKTVIAHPVAKRRHEARLLPSSFFFDRDVPDSVLHRVPGKPQCRLVVQCTSLHPAYRTMNECILAVCTCVSDPILFLLELPVNRLAHIPLPPFSDCSQLTYHHASSFRFIPPLIQIAHCTVLRTCAVNPNIIFVFSLDCNVFDSTKGILQDM